MPDGKIKSQETETIFCSPSAWAMHCKRIINPDKKSGCGWASVKYKGKKLDAYKAAWLRKCQSHKESINSEDGRNSFIYLEKKKISSFFNHKYNLGENDLDQKQDRPDTPIKRIILPFNTVNNRNILQ